MEILQPSIHRKRERDSFRGEGTNQKRILIAQMHLQMETSCRIMSSLYLTYTNPKKFKVEVDHGCNWLLA